MDCFVGVIPIFMTVFAAWISLTESTSFSINNNDTHLSVSLDDIKLIEHSPTSPFLFSGSGVASIKGRFGNYKICDFVEERTALGNFSVSSDEDGRTHITFSNGCAHSVTMEFVSSSDNHYMEFVDVTSDVSRLWVRFFAEENERVYGAGEQFTYFNMRGKVFPLWIQEQGVGRNKSSLITLLANNRDGGGGDYYTTYWAQPTYLSSRKYYVHFTTSMYSEFDFRFPDFHEIYLWGNSPGRVYFITGSTYLELVSQFSGFIGRQPLPPEWMYKGTVLGVQGGTDLMLHYLKLAEDNDIQVSGLWIQDWAGRIKTSFGRRIFWNWEWDPKHYPNLDTVVPKLKEKGIRVLVYANLNLNRDGNLYKEAESLGYLILNKAGETYVVDYGEFFCGIVDITNPDAAQWFKDRIIKKNMIDFGFGGWMADFGEYLPTDAVFHSGLSGEELHNEWPTMWARVNREAVEEAGKVGEILYWMRAGYSGSQKYGVMTWAGDQFVDFSLSDGLASVIPAALSLGVSGFGLFHFDIGGYTSLFGYTRTEELFFRYAEMSAFTTMMRTHEGNRPDENVQFYSNERTLHQLARNTKIYTLLNDYRRIVVRENTEQGIPVQRALFMHYESDMPSYDIQYEYLFGRDLLVAPVYERDVKSWEVYLPPDDWVFLWNEEVTSKGGETLTVPSPIGCIPVFFRRDSEWASTFRAVRKIGIQNDISSDNQYCESKKSCAEEMAEENIP